MPNFDMRFQVIGWPILCHSLWILPMISLMIIPRIESLDPIRGDQRMRIAMVLCLILPAAFAGLHFMTRNSVGRSISDRIQSISSHPTLVSPDSDIALTIRNTGPANQIHPMPEIRSWEKGLQRVSPWIVFIWFVGATVVIVRFAVGALVFRSFLRHRPANPEIQNEADRLTLRIGLRRTPRVCISDRVAQPILIGFIHPNIILPETWLESADRDLQEAVLAHELAHARRCDLWNLLFERIASAAWFFHPAMHRLAKKSALWRELAADRIAADATGKPFALACALESVAAWAAGQKRRRFSEVAALTFAASRPHSDLIRRVEAVLGKNGVDPMQSVKSRIIKLFTAGCLSITCIWLAQPGFAGSNAADEAQTGNPTQNSIQVYGTADHEGPQVAHQIYFISAEPSQVDSILEEKGRKLSSKSGRTFWLIDPKVVIEPVILNPKNNVVQAPKITSWNRQEAVIWDAKVTPIVTGTREVEIQDQDPAFGRHICLVPEITNHETGKTIRISTDVSVTPAKVHVSGKEVELRVLRFRESKKLDNAYTPADLGHMEFDVSAEVPESQGIVLKLGETIEEVAHKSPQFSVLGLFYPTGRPLRTVQRYLIVKPIKIDAPVD